MLTGIKCIYATIFLAQRSGHSTFLSLQLHITTKEKSPHVSHQTIIMFSQVCHLHHNPTINEFLNTTLKTLLFGLILVFRVPKWNPKYYSAALNGCQNLSHGADLNT